MGCLPLTTAYSPQTPFTFGMNKRAPYTAGDSCLLCRCERKDTPIPPEAGISGQNGTTQPNKAASALQLPLWVCSDCRRTVEKEDRHTALEQSLGVRRHGVTVSRCCAGRCRKFKDDGEKYVNGVSDPLVLSLVPQIANVIRLGTEGLMFNSHSCSQSLSG